MKPRPVLRSALALGLTAALISPSSALAPAGMTQIGVAGGVKGPVKAIPPGDKPVGRDLASGQPLYLNEKISTGPEGSLQVMLIDETVFTIGPNSSMTLDEFVYDPQSRSGKVAARVTKGVFRFVTGQIGHKKPSDMTVKFPTGTMGIRGTIVAGQVTESGTTAVLLGPGPAMNAAEERVGAFSMENAGARVDVVKPGYGTRIDGPNSPPSAPALVTQAQLSGILDSISHKPQAPAGQRASAEPADSSTPSDSGDDRQASATDESGQGTAQAGGDLSDTQDIADLGADTGNAALAAANDIGNPDLASFIAQNQASWDDVRSITSGTGYYSGVDSFNLTQCSGGACAGPTGTVSVYLDIDFGAKTVGSAVSNVTVSASDANLPGPITDVVNFGAASFAATAGAATLSGTSGAGTSADIALLNVGGTAGMAVAIAKYNAGGTIGSGVVGAPLVCTAGACR